MKKTCRPQFSQKIAWLALTLIASFSTTSFAQSDSSKTVRPNDTAPRLSFQLAPDKTGKLTRQTLTFRKPGSKPLVIEHGLNLPTFSDPSEYDSDVARYQQDAYILKMVSIGAETEVIRNFPADLKGEKLREWMRSQATIVENSMCSNPAVKTEIMQFFRNAVKAPPPRTGPPRGAPIDPARPRKKSPTMV